MRRPTSAMCFTGLLLLSLPGWCQEQTPNLVANASFEQVAEDGMPESWGTWLKELPEPDCIRVDDTVAHSGRRSLRISQGRFSSYSMVTQRVQFEPGKQYVITGWIKAQNIQRGDQQGSARLFVGKEGNNPFIGAEAFWGTFDWRFIEMGPFEAKERTWLTLIPYLHKATGTVWYDDIALREVTAADLKRRAQARARRLASIDLNEVERGAHAAGADALLPQITDLRSRLQAADDLPTDLPPRTPPPWFPLHDEVFRLMARVNQVNWARVEHAPSVAARWVRPFEDVHPVMACLPTDDGAPETLQMLRQEVEPACLRLTNLTLQSQTASLSVTPLKTGDGTVLPASNLTWRELRYVQLRDATVTADPLVRLGIGTGPVQVSLSPGMTRDVWLMVSSYDTRAGRYESRLTVQATDQRSELALSVLIHPLDFPDQVSIHTFAYAYTFWSLLKGRIPQSRADLIAHRINTYVIQRYFTPWPKFDDENNWLGLDWEEMDAQIALHPGAKCLLLIPSLAAGDGSGRLPPKGGPEYPSDEWKALVARWARELAQGMKQRGFDYDQWGLYLVDEPSGERARLVRHAGDGVHQGDPNIRVFANPYGSATDEDMQFMAPAVDIWCPSLDTAGGERLDFCRETAPEVWMYQVLGKRSHPLDTYRLAFWEAYVKELDGYGFWDYADCRGSVWDAYDHPRHDYAVVYDGDESELTPSKRWEAYREGAEDFAMLAMLAQRPGWNREKVAKLAQEVLDIPDAQLIDEARRWLVRLLAGVDQE